MESWPIIFCSSVSWEQQRQRPILETQTGVCHTPHRATFCLGTALHETSEARSRLQLLSSAVWDAENFAVHHFRQKQGLGHAVSSLSRRHYGIEQRILFLVFISIPDRICQYSPILFKIQISPRAHLKHKSKQFVWSPQLSGFPFPGTRVAAYFKHVCGLQLLHKSI